MFEEEESYKVDESGTTRFSDEGRFEKYIVCWGFVDVLKSAEAKIVNMRDVPFL